MSQLFAKVRLATGVTRDLGDDENEPAARAEIFPDEWGFFLFRYTAYEKFAGDSWHETLAEAKAQALAELSILPDDWSAQRL